MKRNKNDIRVLKFLTENSKQTNIELSKKLGITPQAIGKIRKKLEKTGIIKGHTVEVDMGFIGIRTFAIALFSHSPNVTPKQKLEESKQYLQNPNVISFCKISQGDVTHAVMYGFKDLNELENHLQETQEKTGSVSSLKRLYIFSDKGFVKNSMKDLIASALESK